jgi:hypothetical protein
MIHMQKKNSYLLHKWSRNCYPSGLPEFVSPASAVFFHIRTRIVVVFKIGSFTYDPFLWWVEYVFDISRIQVWTLSGALYPTPEKLGFNFNHLDTIGYTCDLQLWMLHKWSRNCYPSGLPEFVPARCFNEVCVATYEVFDVVIPKF